MYNPYPEFAKLFKERDNVSKIGIIVAKVLKTDGFRILSVSIGNGTAIDGDMIIVCKNLEQYEIKEDDLVVVIASEHNDRFFVIDKVG